MTTYNHAFDIAFSLVNNSPTGEATALDLLAALERRVVYLSMHPEEVVESCGAPYDTYAVEELRTPEEQLAELKERVRELGSWAKGGDPQQIGDQWVFHVAPLVSEIKNGD